MNLKHQDRISIFQLPFIFLIVFICSQARLFTQPITFLDQRVRVEIRQAGFSSARITIRPLDYTKKFPENPALGPKIYPDPAISINEINGKISRPVGNLMVEVSPKPLTIEVKDKTGKILQNLGFGTDGSISFNIGNSPILGMGEGGPRPERNVEWRDLPVEFDRRGRYHEMQPRWQSNAYGSRNPVPLMISTEGWGLFIATPWVEVNLENGDLGSLIPWEPPKADSSVQNRRNQGQSLGKGKPPVNQFVKGLYDIFVFDTHDPAKFMKDLSEITGPAVLPPKWALGYMQSHRTLEDDSQMLDIVKTFRKKQLPIDAVIYLGTGFCPRGWNKPQPSFEFNPEVYRRNPKNVLDDMHDQNVKIIVHMVPWDRDQLPTLHGSIPVKEGELLDESHIQNYWQQHVELMNTGIDAFWPDEGDWFNLFERIKRHEMYYVGPISSFPDIRPWSLHRNGYLGISKWGGWVWSGDTQSSWKTLEGQIAVGINHSLSVSPYWGSDIGGFYPNPDYTGEMFARWFQFASFCPSFRSHGRTWWTHLPWGWGLSDMGPRETNNRNDNSNTEQSARRNPLQSEMENPQIELVSKKYAELRYQLMPYTYTLSWEARESGMPLMRALWLHYPEDDYARDIGDQFLFGRDLLIAPVYEKEAVSRQLYLPSGTWYDWWTNEKKTGSTTISRKVNLGIMPIYVRAGAIVPFDPVRQYTNQEVNEPTKIKIYEGRDGEFTLYEDDGISLDYLEGKYDLTRFAWDDAEKKLVIEPVHLGMPVRDTKHFVIELLPQGILRELEYRNTRVELGY